MRKAPRQQTDMTGWAARSTTRVYKLAGQRTGRCARQQTTDGEGLASRPAVGVGWFPRIAVVPGGGGGAQQGRIFFFGPKLERHVASRYSCGLFWCIGTCESLCISRADERGPLQPGGRGRGRPAALPLLPWPGRALAAVLIAHRLASSHAGTYSGRHPPAPSPQNFPPTSPPPPNFLALFPFPQASPPKLPLKVQHHHLLFAPPEKARDRLARWSSTAPN